MIPLGNRRSNAGVLFDIDLSPFLVYIEFKVNNPSEWLDSSTFFSNKQIYSDHNTRWASILKKYENKDQNRILYRFVLQTSCFRSYCWIKLTPLVEASIRFGTILVQTLTIASIKVASIKVISFISRTNVSLNHCTDVI